MTTFDDRENAYENMFVHDEELRFKANARCNKLLALWAAGKMNKAEGEIDAYVAEVIKSDFEEAGHEDVIRKVAGDLDDLSSAEEVRAKRAELLAVAQKQVAAEA
ncbi:MAG: aldolase [Rhodobacterales bacterium]|nr:MAG: aldolase [Rhodobacterales bacterium]